MSDQNDNWTSGYYGGARPSSYWESFASRAAYHAGELQRGQQREQERRLTLLQATSQTASSLVTSPAVGAWGENEAGELFTILAFMEGAALATGTAYLLWDRPLHHAIALVPAILVIWGYLRGVLRQTTVYWTLVPRMVIWAVALAWASAFVSSLIDYKFDVLWQALSGCVGAALVWWNACRAKQQLPDGTERSRPEDSTADESFRVLVGLESAGLAFGVGYALWDHIPFLPYNAVPLLAGAAFGAAYFLGARKQQTIYWMLLPRMLMWGGAISWALAYGYKNIEMPTDLGWQLFGGSISAALILWNGRLAKRKLSPKLSRPLRRPRSNTTQVKRWPSNASAG